MKEETKPTRTLILIYFHAGRKCDIESYMDERRPLMEDNLRWKTPSMEDNLLLEYDLKLTKNINRRQPSIADKFDKRQP